jgi:putative two-component system response regulator
MLKKHSSQINATILLVDDSDNLTLIGDLLKNHYKTVETVSYGNKALERAQSSSLPPDIILLDITLPKAEGYELCKQLKAGSSTRAIPILFLVDKNDLSEESYVFEVGAEDYITKPISTATALARIKTHLEVKRLKAITDNQVLLIESQVQERTTNLMVTQYAAIYAMGYLSGVRENITGNHIWRNQHYVKALAEKLRFHPRFSSFLCDDSIIEMLFMTAPLHDIGNVGIPDRILLKPGRLTPDEFEIVKNHTQIGRNVILQTERDFGIEIPILKFAKEIIYSHHEKWDGSGYPEGITGNNIPIPARIIAIADVYDALIRRLVYKPAVPHDKAGKIILEGRGTHFDPDMVDAFHEIHEDFQRIAHTYADSEQDFRKKIDYLEKAIAINP